MLIDTCFRKTGPQERIEELRGLVQTAGLNPDEVLIRLFNLSRLQKVRDFGTDRAGIDEVEDRPYNPDRIRGHDKKLQEMGLRLEDGLYMTDLDANSMCNHAMFKKGILVKGSYGVAIYPSSAMELLDWDFYVFRNPSAKRESLVGIVVEKD